MYCKVITLKKLRHKATLQQCTRRFLSASCMVKHFRTGRACGQGTELPREDIHPAWPASSPLGSQAALPPSRRRGRDSPPAPRYTDHSHLRRAGCQGSCSCRILREGPQKTRSVMLIVAPVSPVVIDLSITMCGARAMGFSFDRPETRNPFRFWVVGEAHVRGLYPDLVRRRSWRCYSLMLARMISQSSPLSFGAGRSRSIL